MTYFELLTLINTFLITTQLVVFLKKHQIFYFSIDRTFFKKIPYRITLMRVTSCDKYGKLTSASGVFSIKFRNEKKVKKLDKN